MTTILAFDTSLDKMYITLKKDGIFLSSEVVENRDNKYHSAFLISTIQNVLSKNNIKPENIDLLAVNIGPGSFTGIRACTTVARVMAQQLNCRAIGISSLEILSQIAKNNPFVALDARKNMAYVRADNEIKGAIPLEKVQEMLKAKDYEIITDDKLKPILGGKSYQQQNYPLGEILASLAEQKIKNMSGNWGELLPLYIQPPPMG